MPEFDRSAKSAAKKLAQDVTAEIDDRHLKARLRTRCYNQAVTLLDEQNQAYARGLLRARHTVLAAAVTGLLLGCLGTWALIG